MPEPKARRSRHADSTDVTSKGGKDSLWQKVSEKKGTGGGEGAQGLWGAGNTPQCYPGDSSTDVQICKSAPHILTHTDAPSTAPAVSTRVERLFRLDCAEILPCMVLAEAIRELLNSQDRRVLTSPAHLSSPFHRELSGASAVAALDCQL